MTEKCFVDSNVLVYARDLADPTRAAIAKDWIERLWKERAARTSIQVLNEMYTVLTRKLKPRMSVDDAWDDVQAYLAWEPQPLDRELLMKARQVELRYRLSWWDSMIVAAAQLQACDTLLTEDLQSGMNFDGVVVHNPFLYQVQEPRAVYAADVKPVPRHRRRGRPRKVRFADVSGE
jgi:predicted nucleic acid-binding protein